MFFCPDLVLKCKVATENLPVVQEHSRAELCKILELCCEPGSAVQMS